MEEMNENYNIRRVGHKIADMIYDIDTYYRGDLFFIISDRLQELTQGYTAELFNQIGNTYISRKIVKYNDIEPKDDEKMTNIIGHPKMTRKEVKEMDEHIKNLQFRIKMEWESYQYLQDEYRKLTGREYMWLR